mmetsp:Transcript_11592/g.36704  ORF Transcript_11592/g.36704 Transcript_11592/m.36704 type:complete len:208 (-) Transcript_11592:568-1191(-)
MVTLATLSYRVRSATHAWPASCTAIVARTRAAMWLGRRSPICCFSSAASTSASLITDPLRHAVAIAASLSSVASSAPEKPEVRRASEARSTSADSSLPLACTRKMSTRSSTLGGSMGTRRSKRPARRRAGSSTSARFVAPITTTPVSPSKPSISVSSWLSVREDSAPPGLESRRPPRASISSMKTMHGRLRRASANRARTLLAPTPT